MNRDYKFGASVLGILQIEIFKVRIDMRENMGFLHTLADSAYKEINLLKPYNKDI